MEPGFTESGCWQPICSGSSSISWQVKFIEFVTLAKLYETSPFRISRLANLKSSPLLEDLNDARSLHTGIALHFSVS